MILVVSQVVETYYTITLLPFCLSQALSIEGSMDIVIFCSKRCILGTQHHLQIVLVNLSNPISFNVQLRIPKRPMLLQPHLTYTF
jgi:flagellar assembly factor FliW